MDSLSFASLGGKEIVQDNEMWDDETMPCFMVTSDIVTLSAPGI